MRRSSWLVLCVLVACGPDPLPSQGVTIAQYRSGLTISGAGGCDTSIASGLSNQLVEELNCLTPNLMVNFSGPHVTLYSSVIPYLAADAAQDLKDATVALNDTMTVSSAYRTLAQQALLYRWWQQGQCGIQVAAVPGSSNHQSGRAIDTPYYSTWKAPLTARGWTWLGSSDVVHFDHLASPNIASKSILAFQKLWNKNHATDRLDEDGQWGPATSSAMDQSPTTGFAVHGCATTGKVSGTITQQGAGTALSGVTVTAGGSSVTTGAAGTFELTLAPGPVTVTASKAGFVSSSVSRTVTTGGTVSASMALTPTGATTTLSGTVVDQSSPVAGASVSVAGQSATSDASGAFQFTLPAGTVTLTVSKPGFVVNTSQVTLVAGTPKTVTVALVRASGDQPPVLELDGASGTSLEQAHLVLAGSAVDDTGALATVQLAQNGLAPRAVPVVGGRFEAAVQLTPGLNTFVVSATDAAAQTSTVTWTASFRAGFSGLVHRFDDVASIAVDAELTLFDPDTQVAVGHARTGPDGRYALDASAVGVLRLHVEKAGFTPRDLLVDVSADERTVVDVGLTLGDGVGVRFLEPTNAGPFEVEVLTVSGVVTGFEVAAVTVNDVAATLVGNGFVAHVPLPEGRTQLVAVAEGAGGESVRETMTVFRPLGEVRGGCASAPGLWLAAVVLWARRRRR
jgi:hypothetical protein